MIAQTVRLDLDHVRQIFGPRGSALLRKGVWGIADQALISATNFMTMVLLARGLGPAAFGAFAVAYTVLLATNSFQAALITQPHHLFGATRQDDDYVQYTTAVAIGQIGLALGLAIVVAISAAVAYLAGWSRAAPLLAALAPIIVAWQFQEFVRRVLYTKTDTRGAFTNDLISYGGQVLGVAAIWRLGLLTEMTVLAVLGATSALASIVGLVQLRSHIDWAVNADRLRAATAEHWRFGKWLVGSNLVSWTSGQAYPVLIAGLVSVTATGIMRAVSTVLGPGNIVVNALETLLTPRAATVYAREGVPAFQTFIRRAAIGVTCLMGGYSLVVAVFAEPILRVLYGDQYSEYGWLLALVALHYVLISTRTVASIGLRSMGHTSPIFRAYLCSAAATLTVGIVALHTFGLIGAALGILMNAVITNAVLWRYFRQALDVRSTMEG